MNDGLCARELFFVNLINLVLHPPGTGQHIEHPGQGAHFFNLLQLTQEIIECESLREELFFQLRGFFLIKRFLGLLDQGENVSQVENSTGHAIGVEYLEFLDLFSGGGKEYGAAGHPGDTQSSPAFGITIELGENDPGEIDTIEEGLGGVDCVLTHH